MAINYRKELDKLIADLNNRPALLLHACCAPCSSYCLEYLTQYFDITVYFYNPNISESDEYMMRKEELKRFVSEYTFENEVRIIEGDYNPDEFYQAARGLEKCPERGERCMKCYALRLRKTALLAKKLNSDYFCTTLSISPLKDAAAINEIGYRLEKETGVSWLPSDFKKKEGYKRSIELSGEYGLYRQNYCGCIYSKNQQL